MKINVVVRSAAIVTHIVMSPPLYSHEDQRGCALCCRPPGPVLREAPAPDHLRPHSCQSLLQIPDDQSAGETRVCVCVCVCVCMRVCVCVCGGVGVRRWGLLLVCGRCVLV